MSIKAKKGNVELEGRCDDILTELSMIILAFRKGGMPKVLIDNAIEVGFEEYKKEKDEKDDQNKDFRQLLRNLELED